MKNNMIGVGRKLLNIVRYALGGIFALFAIFCSLAIFIGDNGDSIIVLVVFAIAFLISAVALLRPRKSQNAPAPIVNELNKTEQPAACVQHPTGDQPAKKIKVVPKKLEPRSTADATSLTTSSSMQPSVSPSPQPTNTDSNYNSEHDDDDALFSQAVDVIFEAGQATVTILQRNLKLGYLQADDLIDRMERMGIVGPFEGSVQRKILINYEQWLDIRTKCNFPIPEKPQITQSELIIDEHEWRREHLGVSEVEYELARVDCMSGIEFEHWCSKLLSISGFDNIQLTPASNDQGVDLLAEFKGVKYAVQCKCYSSDLGNKPVQEVNAGKVIYNCHVGVVTTNRHFTAGAIAAAKATGVLLWDRDTLADMLKPLLESDSNRKLLRLQNDM